MSRVIRKYNVYCETCAAWHEEWAEALVEACPINPGHTLTTSKTYISDTITEEMPLDQYERIRVCSTSKRNPKSWTQFSSAGDTSTLYAGNALAVSCTTETPSKSSDAVEFRDLIELHYGVMHFKGAKFGDKASFGFWAKGNTVVDGADHILQVPVEGLGANILVQHPNGTKSISGSVIPVDAVKAGTWEPDGYWNKVGTGYTFADFEFRPNKDGYFNLFDADVFLMNIGTYIWLLGDGKQEYMNEDAALIHPGWYCKLTLYNSDAARTIPLQAVLMLKTNREKTR